jgi:hypothetical protein
MMRITLKQIEEEPNPFRKLKLTLTKRIGRDVSWTDVSKLLGISASRMRRIGCGMERPFNPATATRWATATNGLLSVDEQLLWRMTAKPRRRP